MDEFKKDGFAGRAWRPVLQTRPTDPSYRPVLQTRPTDPSYRPSFSPLPTLVIMLIQIIHRSTKYEVICERSTMDNLQPGSAGAWIFGGGHGPKNRICLRRPVV